MAVSENDKLLLMLFPKGNVIESKVRIIPTCLVPAPFGSVLYCQDRLRCNYPIFEEDKVILVSHGTLEYGSLVQSPKTRVIPSLDSSLDAARQCKKELDASSTQPQTPSESTSLSAPVLEFPSSPTPMEPPSDQEEFPDSVAAPVRTMRSTTGKRKSEVTSDISDAELGAPARKKPGPKPKVKTVKPASKVDSSEPESEPKLTKKKPGPKPKPKCKAVPKARKSKRDVESDEEDIEIVTPATVAPKIVFMIPETTTEGNQHVSVKSSASFDDAIELMHETIGCVGVKRKPTLAYKSSTANKTTSTINLCTEEDWEGLVTDVLAKMKGKKDISISISVLPENYMVSLHAKNKRKAPATKTGKGKGLRDEWSDKDNPTQCWRLVQYVPWNCQGSHAGSASGSISSSVSVLPSDAPCFQVPGYMPMPAGPPTATHHPVMSSDPPDDAAAYPFIVDFIETLIDKVPQWQSLWEAGQNLRALAYYGIDEIITLVVNNFGTDKFGKILRGDAEYLLGQVKKEVKQLDKVTR
ncbi:hypothetical protein B0H17DRAFT_1175407 [Mycena rosella]|uniref:Uncharacterized protein n=1 Tax=Mycena rosella TaxID=1033263 RepID=A0AAD7GT89_MYCRO|nr:hypothetical protein B0H17DRAFT_1175407 [Mycena rosella]